MKKVLATALVCCTVSAFAAWDKFPVIEDGKGEVKIFAEQGRRAYEGDDGFGFKVRYSPLANLELTSQLWGDAWGNYVLGARYQIISLLSAGVDFGVPLGEGATWSFKPNVQFSMPLTSALTLGSNFDLAIYTPTPEAITSQDVPPGFKVKYTRGLDFNGGIELDLALTEKSTIWVGFDAAVGLTRSKAKVDPAVPGMSDELPLKDDGPRTLALTPQLGYIATIGNLALGTYVALTIGPEGPEYEEAGKKHNVNEKFRTAVGVDAALKF